MTNILDAVIPKIISVVAPSLRENAIMPRLVTADYAPTTAQKGSTVTIPIPSAMSTNDVVPGPYAPATSSLTIPSVILPLNRWKESAFTLTLKDLEEIQEGSLVNLQSGTGAQVVEAVRALANVIDSDILNTLYKATYNYVGSAGTTPFGTDTTEAQECRRYLNKSATPVTNRYMVLGVDADANAIGLPAFQSALNAGTDITIKEGLIGRKLGFDWYSDQNMPDHVSGTGTGYLVNQVGHAIGDNTVIVDTGTGTILEGDIFTVAGDTQTYVVTSFAGSIITYEPAAKTAFANNAAITLKASHAVNLAFHRQAVAFAMRPMVANELNVSTEANMSMVDPVTGIPLKVSIRYEFEQYRVAISALWGCVVVRPECAVRLVG